jgi:hypothetical protein
VCEIIQGKLWLGNAGDARNWAAVVDAGVEAAAISIVQGGSPDDKLRSIVTGYPHDVSPQL